jgi:peroxin-19
MEADKAGMTGKPEKDKPADRASSADPRPTAHVVDVGDAPDPDEDDLDDLDDMLEEFSTVKLDTKTTVPKPATVASTASTSGSTATGDGVMNTDVPLPELDDFSEEEFQKQLQAGMAELMGDLEDSVNLPFYMMCFRH